MQVHIYQLDNGLTVYLTQNHEAPTFRSEITVRAGSKDDPENATGLAHYLEHLLFKGSNRMGTTDWEKEKVHIDRIEELYEEHFAEEDEAKRAEIYAEIGRESQLAAQYAIPNEIDKMLSSLGGSGLNASTSFDRTVYYENMPANRLEQWAQIEAERFRSPVFRLFQPELEIVYEEKNRAMDNKNRLIQNAVFELRYGEHPYGSQTGIGTIEHLKRPSLKRIHEFYNAHYVPNNMAVALSGDFEIETAIEVIDRNFSWMKPGKVPVFSRPMPSSITERKSVEIAYPGEEYILLGFETQPLNSVDVEALKLIDMIMDNSSAGLINLNLNQQQKVLRAGSFPYLRNDAGTQYLYGIPKQGQTVEEVETLLLEQLDLIKSGQFGDWILPAIVTDFKKYEKLAMETNEGRLRAITTSFGSYTDWSYVVGEIARIEKIDKEEIVRVANKYFGDAYVVGYRRDGEYTPPKIAKPELKNIDIDRSRQSAFAASALEIEASPIEPSFVEMGVDYQVVSLRDGARLLYARNPVNDLFSLSKVFEFGSEEMRELGVLASLMDKSGAGEMSPAELKKAWYALGAEFGFAVGPHATTMSVSGLDENFDASLELFAEATHGAKLEQDTLDQLVAIRLKLKEDQKKDFNQIFNALRNYSRFKEESPYLRALSTDELKALQAEELGGFLKSIHGYKHDYLYVGTLELDDVVAKLKMLDESEGALRDAPARKVATYRNAEEDTIYYVDFETAQAQLRIEFADGKYDASLKPKTELFNEYFYGGMSGIVFQEMREARALAYSVWARIFVPAIPEGTNTVAGYIGTQADKTIDALEAYLDLWKAMPHSESRYNEVMATLDSQYRVSRIGFRNLLNAAKAWERLGIEGDPRRAVYEEIMSMDIDDLFDFYGERIQNRARLISVLGPSSSFDVERLKELGSVKQVEIDALFVD